MLVEEYSRQKCLLSVYGINPTNKIKIVKFVSVDLISYVFLSIRHISYAPDYALMPTPGLKESGFLFFRDYISNQR